MANLMKAHGAKRDPKKGRNLIITIDKKNITFDKETKKMTSAKATVQIDQSLIDHERMIEEGNPGRADANPFLDTEVMIDEETGERSYDHSRDLSRLQINRLMNASEGNNFSTEDAMYISVNADIVPRRDKRWEPSKGQGTKAKSYFVNSRTRGSISEATLQAASYAKGMDAPEFNLETIENQNAVTEAALLLNQEKQEEIQRVMEQENELDSLMPEFDDIDVSVPESSAEHSMDKDLEPDL